MRSLKKTRKLINKQAKRWSSILGLGWWKVDFCYYDEPEAVLRHFRVNDQEVVAARVFSDWRYSEATIDINLPFWREMSRGEIERNLVHEFFHILVNEMREGDITHEERVVSTLTKAAFWILDIGGKAKYAKSEEIVEKQAGED